jgi:hypothetical protein
MLFRVHNLVQKPQTFAHDILMRVAEYAVDAFVNVLVNRMDMVINVTEAISDSSGCGLPRRAGNSVRRHESLFLPTLLKLAKRGHSWLWLIVKV